MDLPSAVAFCVADMAINAGQRNAVKTLQKSVGLTGRDVDGFMGPRTRKALEAKKIAEAVKNFSEERKSYYSDIVRRKPDQKAFINGWINRVQATEEQALKMAK